MSNKKKPDRDIAAAWRACVSGSPREWNKDDLLAALDKALSLGWTGPMLKAWAWQWRPPRSKRVTPGSYRTALALLDINPDSERSPLSSWRLFDDFKANPDAYSYDH